MRKINYFVKINDISDLYFRRWYVDEIDIFKTIFEVNVNTSIFKISNSDIYYSWWAQTSIPSVLRAIFENKKSIVVAGGSEVSQLTPSFGYNSKNIFKRIILKITLLLCDHIIAVSEYNKKEIIDLIGNKYENKISVIYHCVSEEYFKNELTNKYKEKYILLISALTQNNIKRKCIKECIEAIRLVKKEIPDIKLIIVGQQENGYIEIMKIIKEYELEKNVKIFGEVSEEQKLELLKGAYCYLQPTNHEQFGLAIAESMACGCPVISTDVAAVPEVVSDTGILISDNTPIEINNAIKKIYKDKTYRDELSSKAKKRAENVFSYRKKKDALISLVLKYLK